MKNLTILLFLLFYTATALAEMKGKITFSDLEVNQGDTVNAHLMIERASLSFILQEEDLAMKNISSSLVITKAESIKVSENNADIIEAEVLVTVLANLKENEPLILELLQDKVILELKQNISINPHGVELPKEFVWLDFSLKIPWDPRILKLLLWIGGFALVLLAFLAFKLLKKKKREKESSGIRKKNYELWKKKIREAKKREDFEELFLARQKWSNFIVDNKVARGFSLKMEEHQYKKVWDEDVFNDVRMHQERLMKMIEEGKSGV